MFLSYGGSANWVNKNYSLVNVPQTLKISKHTIFFGKFTIKYGNFLNFYSNK